MQDNSLFRRTLAKLRQDALQKQTQWAKMTGMHAHNFAIAWCVSNGGAVQFVIAKSFQLV